MKTIFVLEHRWMNNDIMMSDAVLFTETMSEAFTFIENHTQEFKAENPHSWFALFEVELGAKAWPLNMKLVTYHNLDGFPLDEQPL